jgi:triacylglycerol esterase/lipase EstA (alpha/beta hydrolase family)
MTAFFLLALLVAGGWAYFQWAAHSVAQGASVWWFVAGAPVVYLAPAAVLVAVWLVVAWVWRTPRPPDARLGPGGTLRLYLIEVLSLGLSWPLMALHWLLIRDPLPAPAKRPVVLIHGVLVNDGVWFVLRRFLMRRGGAPVYTLNYGPPFADIERFAEQLAARIEAICAVTGAERVLLVAHSMGGLVARAYLRRFGPGRVAGLVTIGTPHHGSILAYSFPGRGLTQMHPGNPWLTELNRDESKPAPIPMTSIWSRHDSMVIPQASSVLACAENVAVIGIAHNALVRDQGVMELVARKISKTPGRANTT